MDGWMDGWMDGSRNCTATPDLPPRRDLLSIPAQSLLIPSESPIPSEFMLDHRAGIAALGSLGGGAAGIRVVNGFPLDVRQLRDPFADVVAVRVVFLALEQRVEDAEIGLRVDAGGGAEAPAAVVGGEVAVDEARHEIALAQPPVEKEVFGQEGGRRHACAVVHVTRVVHLAHGRVDEGVARAPGTPGVEMRRRVLPRDVGVFGFERFVHAGRKLDSVKGEKWRSGDGFTIQKASEQGHAYKSLARPLLISSW